MLSLRTLSWSWRARLAFAATAASAAAFSVFMTGDRLLQTQVNDLFVDAGPMTSIAGVAATSTTQANFAGTEDFWLGDIRTGPATPAAWHARPPLTVGQDLTLSLGGKTQALRVMAVEFLPTAEGVPETGNSTSAPRRPMLVKLKTPSGHGMHLIVESSEDLQQLTVPAALPREL